MKEKRLNLIIEPLLSRNQTSSNHQNKFKKANLLKTDPIYSFEPFTL